MEAQRCVELTEDVYKRQKLLRYRPFGVCEEGLRFCGRTITPLEEAQRLAQAESDRGFHNWVVI